jgi:hypothetical protein
MGFAILFTSGFLINIFLWNYLKCCETAGLNIRVSWPLVVQERPGKSAGILPEGLQHRFRIRLNRLPDEFWQEDEERQEQDACADECERQCGDAGEPDAGRDRDVSREQGCILSGK